MADQPLSKYTLKMMVRIAREGVGPNAVERAMQDVIDEAIKDERERCAKIADEVFAESGRAEAEHHRMGAPEAEKRASTNASCAARIAERIRKST